MKPAVLSFTTDHCVTGSMRRIYAHHGCEVSEDLLLGLGSGVGFVYWHMKGQPPLLGGRANVGRPCEEGLERTVGRRTGVRVQVHETGSAAKAERELLAALAHGPVMLKVDMGFLPYFKLPEGYHFGGHVVVAVSCDQAKGRVAIADRDLQLHTIGLEDLAKARGSKFKPFPPCNTRYEFDFSGQHAPAAAEVLASIRECATGMLEPPISNLGVAGIRKSAARVAKWPATMKPDELAFACFNAFVFIDATGGTGGGLFRYMYGRFLAEAAEITGERGLRTVSQGMGEVGNAWQEIAVSFKKASTAKVPEPHLACCVTRLSEVADQEHALWSQLAGLSARRRA